MFFGQPGVGEREAFTRRAEGRVAGLIEVVALELSRDLDRGELPFLFVLLADEADDVTGGAFEQNALAGGKLDDVRARGRLVAGAAVGPVVSAVHELAVPEELGGEVIGAIGDVQSVRETDANRARGNVIDEVTVDRSDAVLGLNRDEDPHLGGLAGLATLGLGEPLVVLILGALVAEHDDFLASELDVFNAQRGKALLQDDWHFLGAATDGSDTLHLSDAFAADVERAEVVAIEDEGILALHRGFELTGPDHRESVLQSGLVGVDHADVEVFHQRGLESGEVR